MGNKTGKLIIKVIYISFAVIIMFFSAIVLFNTAKGDHILNITNKALDEKNYDKILELFGGIYWNEPVIKESKGDTDFLVVPTYLESTVLYYPEDSNMTHMHHSFSNSYGFYIFNSNIKTADRALSGKKINESGVKFIADNGEEYIYYFRVSATVNCNESYEQAKSVNDYYLNHKRDIISDKSKYGFFNFNINQELVEAIEEKLEGQIVKFNITENDGKSVFENDFDFAFNFNDAESGFFAEDQGGVVYKAYTDYLPYYDSYKINQKKYKSDNYVDGVTKDVFNSKTETFNDKVSKFREDAKAGNVYNANLKISLGESEIMTNSVIAYAVWRTIGIEALVLVVVAVIYILLFHFQQLRDFIFRNDRRTPIRAKVRNVEPVEEPNKFKYDQTGNKKTEVKQEPKKEVIDTKPETITPVENNDVIEAEKAVEEDNKDNVSTEEGKNIEE